MFNVIRTVAPLITAFAATNAALPRPTVYVRTRVNDSELSRAAEKDPRVQFIFSNVGGGVMIVESFQWTSHGQPLSDVCQVLSNCKDGSVECVSSRKVYLDKPFEGHAKLHLKTLRPRNPEDKEFQHQIIKDLEEAKVAARITFRYFHPHLGLKRTFDIPLVSELPERV